MYITYEYTYEKIFIIYMNIISELETGKREYFLESGGGNCLIRCLNLSRRIFRSIEDDIYSYSFGKIGYEDCCILSS